ncbi:hypothetical protein [Pseudomonas sp. C2B4]|uniref:hypothetical protein n=1 Tax=Pseudomonas sp. C2B4 TaxID=2735270 RepID=UPI0015864263|nr:hypothetical protein [Pseudomonas sp. C2B4]NUU34748.1 hypothetical protein [Pseudomonas sp. C2B4]
MTYYALVTVDLDNGVSRAARDKFNDELAKKHFSKHKLTTVWTATYKLGTTKAVAISYARNCIDEAAAKAGITTYEALVTISEEKPTEWTKGVNSLLAQALRR